MPKSSKGSKKIFLSSLHTTTTIHMYFSLSRQIQKAIRQDTDVVFTCAHQYPLTPHDHSGHTMDLNTYKAILVPQYSTCDEIYRSREDEIDSREGYAYRMERFDNVTY